MIPCIPRGPAHGRDDFDLICSKITHNTSLWISVVKGTRHYRRSRISDITARALRALFKEVGVDLKRPGQFLKSPPIFVRDFFFIIQNRIEILLVLHLDNGRTQIMVMQSIFYTIY